jgi:hypothetical protein
MHAASGTLATFRLGPGCDPLAYIWRRSWRKPGTLTLPIRPGCAFDPKGDSRQRCVQSNLEALPGSPGDHLLLDEKIATSSTPFQPARCQPRTVSGFAINNGLRQSLNHRLARIQKRRSVSLRRGRGCRRCSTANCWRRQRFSATSSAFGLKIAPMAETNNRNTCAPAAIVPARAPRIRLGQNTAWRLDVFRNIPPAKRRMSFSGGRVYST